MPRRLAHPQQLALFQAATPTPPSPPPTAPSSAPAPRDRPTTLVARGRVHDLEAIRDEVVRRHPVELPPADVAGVAIGWGRAPARRRRGRSISLRLGSYDVRGRLVRIHPALDRPWVPAWLVDFVVYHELLHAALPPVEVPGRRRVVHGAELRRRERRHPRHAESERWIAANLRRLVGKR